MTRIDLYDPPEPEGLVRLVGEIEARIRHFPTIRRIAFPHAPATVRIDCKWIGCRRRLERLIICEEILDVLFGCEVRAPRRFTACTTRKCSKHASA